MNQMVATEGQHKKTAVQEFVSYVLDGSKRAEIKAALPAHVTFERWERNLSNAVMREPKILKCDPRVVFREVAKIAALGLVLDPYLGEAYLIVDRNNDVQARIGYRGLMKLAFQSNKVAAIYAHDICANDFCEIELGTEKRITHKPDFLKDRGEVGAYYAAVKFKDGATDFEPMSIREIHAIRDRSDAFRAFKRGAIKSTPWATDEGEMAKKTTLRRLLKRVPMSPDMEQALSHEDEADNRDRIIDAVRIPEQPRNLNSKLDALADLGGEPNYDPETGEVSPDGQQNPDSPAPGTSATAASSGGAAEQGAGPAQSSPAGPAAETKPSAEPEKAKEASSQPATTNTRQADAPAASASEKPKEAPKTADASAEDAALEADLLDTAKNAAEQGRDALDEFESGCNDHELALMGKHLGALRKRAKAVDQGGSP